MSMVLAGAGGAALLFSLGIVFGLGLLAPPEKIQADGSSRYLARLQDPDEARRIEQDRALSPIYPAGPKVAGDSAPADKPGRAVMSQAQAKETKETKAQPSTSAAVAATPAPPAQAPVVAEAAPAASTDDVKRAPAVPETTGVASAADREMSPATFTQTATAESGDAAPAEAAPASSISANSCDISACSAAYRSFRASDCTYQPYDGPRRLCTSPPAASPDRQQARAEPQAIASTPAPARVRPRSRADLNDVADEVRRLTQDGGFYPPPSMRDDRRMYVIDRY